MKCQMMRVISSPSSSTIGFLTLIFAIRWVPPRIAAHARTAAPAAMLQRKIGPQNSIARRKFQRAEITAQAALNSFWIARLAGLRLGPQQIEQPSDAADDGEQLPRRRAGEAVV